VLKGVTHSEEDPFQSELFQVEEESERGQSSESLDDEGHYPEIEEIINQIDKIVEDMEEVLQSEDADRAALEEDTAPKAATAPLQEEAAGAFSNKPEKEIVTKKTYNNFYNEYLLNACAHTCRMAEFYEDIVPFDRDKTGARWKKIVNITNLPLVSPGAHYFATQYRHYIFGAKPDEKGIATRFYFGIPGRFLDEEQPDGGRSGFTYWQPIRGTDPMTDSYRKGERSSRSTYGYWIVAVDGSTGCIEEV
jgi:hypothetical protein